MVIAVTDQKVETERETIAKLQQAKIELQLIEQLTGGRYQLWTIIDRLKDAIKTLQLR
jgi:hypothetical protein